MNANFLDKAKGTINEGGFNESVTENGAIGYRTTGKELLDLNFMTSSLRNATENEIIDRFTKAFYEDKLLAVKWLFFASDVRGGMGERRLFRVIIKYLGKVHPEITREMINLIPHYSRWDNVLCLLDTPVADDVIKLIDQQLKRDINSNGDVSLLAKWLPSANASSKETRNLARIIIDKLSMSEKSYRKMLSKLRAKIDIVESYMCDDKWYKIKYSSVPSRANIRYSNAFLKHDEERRKIYLDSVAKGERTINAGVLYPSDILHKYTRKTRSLDLTVNEYDETLEQLWKALPDYVNGNSNTICVADGSGSMISNKIGNTDMCCLDVANALAIYFSERLSGPLKDTYITFSRMPQFVNLANGNSLREKIEIALRYDECSNTDIEEVFLLLLRTALDNRMTQEDLPDNILILSDMEFNEGVIFSSSIPSGLPKERYLNDNKKLFKTISEAYEKHGYKLPRLVFWNICSRTGTIPVKENDLGVALVSGFSPTIMDMVLSEKLDPYEVLTDKLNSDRYKPVEDAFNGINYLSY